MGSGQSLTNSRLLRPSRLTITVFLRWTKIAVWLI